MADMKELFVMVPELIRTINENREYLSAIDGETGDGDHGINMSKGFSLCAERLDENTDDLPAALRKLADVLMLEIGGSMGPLYGMFFEGMADQCAGKETMTSAVFADMLAAGLEGILDIGQAREGDKTLLDTLIPAMNAYTEALAGGADFRQALIQMKAAAEQGKESTKDMVARIGRASRLGERSRGVLDAGATSCNLILQSMADTLLQWEP